MTADEMVERLADTLIRRGWGMPLDDPELAEEVRDDWREDARNLLTKAGVLAELDRLTAAIRSHNATKRSPGCGHALNHADEHLWEAIGIDRWGDPIDRASGLLGATNKVVLFPEEFIEPRFLGVGIHADGSGLPGTSIEEVDYLPPMPKPGDRSLVMPPVPTEPMPDPDVLPGPGQPTMNLLEPERHGLGELLRRFLRLT